MDGEGVKNLEKWQTSFMDGPLISTQQTVVENDFNAKQRPERLHLTVGNLEYDVIPSKPAPVLLIDTTEKYSRVVSNQERVLMARVMKFRDVTVGKFMVRPLQWRGRICPPWLE